MSRRIELHPPLGGLSENVSYDDQPPQTTTEAFNMRGLDPETGRVRLAKRAGRSRQHTDRISASDKIADLASVGYTQKTVDYTLSPTSLWDTAVPAKGDVLWCETDLEGNVYALNAPSGIVKYSADGVEVYNYTVPVQSNATLGTLDVDEGANVYTAVSGTRGAPQGLLGSKEPGNGMILGDMDKAQLWKLEHAFRNNDDENEPELSVAWTLTMKPEDPGPTLKGLVGFVRCKGAKLYTLQHDNRQWKSWLVVYDAIHSGVPFETLVQEVPYPASSLDVDNQGRIVITVENFTRRGENPAHPESLAALTGWTLKDIDEDVTGGQKKHKVWFDLDPTKIETLETTGGLIPEDGDEVLFARDANGSGRVLVFATPDGKRGPIWKKAGLGGKPELYFDGSTQLLYTGLSPSGDADFRDGGRGLFPTYRDPDDPDRSSQYAVVALLRPEAKSDGTSLTNQMPVWSHSVDNTTLSDHSALFINRGVVAAAADNLDTLAQADNHVNGAVSWYCRADATDPGEGSATGLMPASYYEAPPAYGPFNNPANALLVSLIACNGVDPGADDTHTRSLMRVWGRPIDRFMQDADANYATAKQWLGGSAHADFSTLAPMYRGSVCRIVVLDRKDLAVVGPLSICSHPAGPDATAGNIVGAVTILDEGVGGANASGNLTFTPTGAAPITPASGTWTSVNNRLTTITLTGSGEGYDAPPTVVATGYTGAEVLQAGMEYKAGTKTSITVMEKIEGMLSWERGVSYLLHSDGFYVVQRINTLGGVGTYSWNAPHPYFYAPGMSPFIDDQGPPENENTVGIHKFSHLGEILVFMDSSGKLLDVLSHELNGIGLGCRFNADGTLIYTVGSSQGKDGAGSLVAANQATLRKIAVKDDGTLGWLPIDGGFGIAAGLQVSGQRCGLKVDANNNVYIPVNAPIDFTDPTCTTFAVLSSNGIPIHAFSAGPAGGQNQGAFCIALPRVLEKADPIAFTPDYEGDVTSKVVEHLFIAGAAASYDGGTVHSGLRKYRLVLATPNEDPPRLRAHLAVAGGNITRFDGVSLSTPTGGNAALNPTGYIHSVATSLGKLYYSDGAKYQVFDPKLNTVEEWRATRGTIPPRCAILEFWRGRNVLTGDGTGFVGLSRILNPDDHDTNPPVPTVTQACTFASSDMGEDVPDRVTGFMPYNDDLATIGCDHSLMSVRGDPMDGGRLDVRSDVTGMAFGRAWCRDATGAGWFIGSRGGLFRQANPTAIPERVSLMKIERRLQEIDFATYYFRLAYDPQREGVWIMALPFGTLDAERIETYFYEIKTDAFWADFINVQQEQVTALHAIDGDGPSDRRILTGHGDGFVRFIDDSATKDDTAAIQASIVMGPYKGPVEGFETRVNKLGMVLASNQSGGCTWRVYASDTPDDKGVAVRSGSFGAGNNLVASAKARGAYFWIELSQTGSPSRFALERAYLDVDQAGRQRVRA